MNKYLEKSARYFYSEAKHFAQHAKDMAGIRGGGLNFRSFSFMQNHAPGTGEGFSNYRKVFTHRARHLEEAAGAKGGLIGGTAGAIAGGSAEYSGSKKKDRAENTLKGILAGGILGAAGGSILGRSAASNRIYNRMSAGRDRLMKSRDARFEKNDAAFKAEYNAASSKADDKYWQDFANRFNQSSHRRSSNSGGSSSFRSSGDIDQLHKDLEFPAGGFKTKSEATKHFRRMSMKHHPDRGGSTEAMSKINAAWDKYKKHPNGFEKLAGLGILEKVAGWIYE